MYRASLALRGKKKPPARSLFCRHVQQKVHFCGDVVKLSEATGSDIASCIYGVSRLGRDAYQLLRWLLNDQYGVASSIPALPRTGITRSENVSDHGNWPCRI